MSAPAPFCSSLYEDLAGEPPPLRILPAPRVPTLLERHLDKLRNFYDAAPTTPTAGGRFYRKLLGVYYRNLIPAGASVLEIGCGAGNLLELLPNRDVVGIDLSEIQVAAARARLPHGKFHVMAGENLQLRRMFDFVTATKWVADNASQLGIDAGHCWSAATVPAAILAAVVARPRATATARNWPVRC